MKIMDIIQRIISVFLRPRLKNKTTFTWNGYDLLIQKHSSPDIWKAVVIGPDRYIRDFCFNTSDWSKIFHIVRTELMQ